MSFKLPSGGTWAITGYFVEYINDTSDYSAVQNVYDFSANVSTNSSAIAFAPSTAVFAGGSTVYKIETDPVNAAILDLRQSTVICFRIA